MADKKDYRKELAEKFLQVLEEKGLDWKKEWSGQGMTPVNVKSRKAYHGINRFALMLTAMQRGYKDPRWATYLQVQEMGLRLKDARGQGVTVGFWHPYDTKERRSLTWDEFKRLDEQIGERYILLCTYSTVFNGDLIPGLAPLPEPELHDVAIDELVDVVSACMGVEILHDGGSRAFYRPGEDKIHLPEPGYFYNDYAYNSTALHELAHATGAPHRLGRQQGAMFGTEAYAYEELVAEISSCFMSTGLAIGQDTFHVDNHKAYVQSWIAAIREKPEMLGKAVMDAEKATAYMEHAAGLIPDREYEESMRASQEGPDVEKKTGKEVDILKLTSEHPATAHGYKYSATIKIDGAYCGNGKFCRTLEEAEEYKKQALASVQEAATVKKELTAKKDQKAKGPKL